MTSLLQTGFGMFSARVGRGRPGYVEKRFLINILCVVMLAGSVVAQTAAKPGAVKGTAKSTGATAVDPGWPQLAGPNKDCVAPNSPKLLDVWPTNGPKLVWQTDGLPYAPLCGIGSPIVAGGKVYTYAHTVEPRKGVKPFAELLKMLGYSADIPEDLNKKIDEAQFGEKRKACTNDAGVEAFTKEFLASLDPAQVKQFGGIIKTRMKVGRRSCDSKTLALWASRQDKDKEIDSRQDFVNIFVEQQGGMFYHGNLAGVILPIADMLYTNQVFVDMMICLDQATGKELWRKSAPGTKWQTGTEFGCSGTPVVTKDRVYYRGSGGLHCLDITKKGELVWSAKGRPGNNTPVLANGVVYCIVDQLEAFDDATGKQLWSQPKVIGENETPILWMHGGKNYLLCQVTAPRYYAPFYCLDAATGKELWMIESGKGEGKEEMLGGCLSGVVVGDTLIARSGAGCAAYALSPKKMERIWATKDCGDTGGTPIVHQNHVYLMGRSYHKDVINVLNAKTGAVTLNIQSDKAGQCSTSLIADGKVFMNGFGVGWGGYRINHLLAVKAIPNKYEEIGSMPTVDVAACSSPAFANGYLYVRLSRGVACYDIRASQQATQPAMQL